jgi:hypothetical protein
MRKNPIVNRTAVAAGALASTVVLASCSTGSHPETQASFASPSAVSGHDMSARGICLSGVHRTPLDNIVVDRALAAPLSLVKAWVLSDREIQWQTLSSALSDAPLGERVAVWFLEAGWN